MSNAVESSQSASASKATAFAAVRSPFERIVHASSEDFFRVLVQDLAAAMGTSHAHVSEFVPPDGVRTLAHWSRDKLVDILETASPDAPGAYVIGDGPCHFASGVSRQFSTLAGIESYVGAPLKAHDGTVLGHLCVFDDRPMPADPQKLLLFQVFEARAAAELDRLRYDARLRESEERFRDLFDEAPIAYVHEGLDTKFIRANRTAQRILGITAEEVEGSVGMSFIPDTPEAQRRVREAFESVGKGIDTSGVVLELRRRNDGKQVFIQWWSRPDPLGQWTRTMFVDITDKVLMEQAQQRLQAQNVYLQEEIRSVHNFEQIVGNSAGLTTVLENVRRVAPTDATVLVCGETGTGKELIARAIHSASKRADKPFIKLNCAALPAALVESEFFGHERGAFSGALQRRIGRFELADTGTIFLDEIGEVPLDVQVKLLRVLQEFEFERLGSSQTIKTNVRVIAATNRDLPKAIAEGSFRSDLFYRLNVFPISVPPLRERAADIPLLVQYFAHKYAPRVGRRVDAIDAESMRRLAEFHWPGNIRELENMIERALILDSSPTLVVGAELLGTVPVPLEAAPLAYAGERALVPSDQRAAPPESSTSDLNSVQREHILNTLRTTNWVIEGERGAACLLGMKAATLRHRMKKLGISRDSRS